QECSPHNQK
ncbi:wall surface anchor family domain protein, partial [Chlamydia psittaci 08-2626_L3]